MLILNCSFSSKYSLISRKTFPFTQGSFRNEVCTIHVFGDFPVSFRIAFYLNSITIQEQILYDSVKLVEMWLTSVPCTWTRSVRPAAAVRRSVRVRATRLVGGIQSFCLAAGFLSAGSAGYREGCQKFFYFYFSSVSFSLHVF